MAIIDFEWSGATSTAGSYNKNGTAHNISFNKDVTLKQTSIDYKAKDANILVPITLEIYELPIDGGVTESSNLIYSETKQFNFNTSTYTKCLFDNLNLTLKAGIVYGLAFVYSDGINLYESWSNETNSSLTNNDLTLTLHKHNIYVKSFKSGGESVWGIQSEITNFSVQVDDVMAITNSFLVQSGDSIKAYKGSWQDIGSAPVINQMFIEHGMADLSIIPEEQWKAIPQDSKILAYTEKDKVFTADVTVHNLYDSNSKNYHGTGIIETETEELPITRKFLMINAEHENCTFKYSLNNGGIWTDIMPGELKDITKENGIQLKIQVNLPTDDSILTAISYAWA